MTLDMMNVITDVLGTNRFVMDDASTENLRIVHTDGATIGIIVGARYIAELPTADERELAESCDETYALVDHVIDLDATPDIVD